jgi:hypothetical protein
VRLRISAVIASEAAHEAGVEQNPSRPACSSLDDAQRVRSLKRSLVDTDGAQEVRRSPDTFR